MKKYTEILINKRIFTYHTEEDVAVGMEVLVPFRNKRASGYIVGIVDEPEFVTKPIVHVVRYKPQFTEDLAKIADYIADYYKCFRSKAYELILPK
ncbi:MAG: hypothetical protein ABIH39_06735 [Candidatus Margulisiibacteriota bacterium]